MKIYPDSYNTNSEFTFSTAVIVGQLYFSKKNSKIIYSLDDSSLCLKKPLAITIEKIDGEFIADIEDLNLWVDAPSYDDAEIRIKKAVVALYKDLKKLGEEKLGNYPLKSWKYLQSYIDETN
jgi:hypothetical protein